MLIRGEYGAWLGRKASKLVKEVSRIFAGRTYPAKTRKLDEKRYQNMERSYIWRSLQLVGLLATIGLTPVNAQVGVTQRVPKTVALSAPFPAAQAFNMDFSGDGRYMVIETTAPLLASDTNGVADVYRVDRQTSEVILVSIARDGTPNGQGSEPSISFDGRYVVFNTSSTLMVQTPNNFTGLVIRDLQAGVTTPVSLSTTNAASNGTASRARVTPDGRFVVFSSTASNLIAGDTNGVEDIFVRDRTNNTTVRASQSDAGVAGNQASARPFISDDGRFVAFESSATNLVADDTNSQVDVFRKDLSNGAIVRASVNATGGQLPVASGCRGMSANGVSILFRAASIQVVNGAPTSAQAYLRNLNNSTTTLVSLLDNTLFPTSSNSVSDDLRLSPNGRWLAFVSTTDGYAAADTNGTSDIILRDLNLGKNSRATLRYDGTQTSGTHSVPVPSNDGRFVGFLSNDQLIIPGDSQTTRDAFIRDLTGATNQLVSFLPTGNVVGQTMENPQLSNDGRFLVFNSTAANLVTGDDNLLDDIFVYDRSTDGVQRISVASNGDDLNALSANPRISADGNWIAFETAATNIEPVGSSTTRLLLKNRVTNQTILVSRRTNGQPGTGSNAQLSADGRYVVFESTERLTADDTNNSADIFRFDRQTNQMLLISITPSGTQTNGANRNASISADGTRVAWESDASNVVPFDFNALADIFVRDIPAQTTQAVSVDIGGILRGGTLPRISGDGAHVAFESPVQLIANSPISPVKTYVRRLSDGRITLVGTTASNGFLNSEVKLMGISTDGQFVCFQASNNQLPGFNSRVQTYIQNTTTKEFFHCSRRGATSSDVAVTISAMSGDGAFTAFRSNSRVLVDELVNFNVLFLHQARESSLTTFNGTLVLQDYVGPRPTPSITLTFEPVGGGTSVQIPVTLNPNGTFAATVTVQGNYNVFAQGGTFLRRNIGTFNFSGGVINAASRTLLNGDCDGDNSITIFDYILISDAFDSAPGGLSWNPLADLDGDEQVTIFDYTILSNNFGVDGD